MNLSKEHPDAYKTVIALNQQAMDAHAAAGLDAKIAELVKIRISQLNGCAFCLRMHTREAIEFGESVDRIAVIAAWWESQYFSEPERAALALAEDVIRLPVPDPKRDFAPLTAEQISAVSGWPS